jgi:DNA-binding MarR family transcriptional regulator
MPIDFSSCKHYHEKGKKMKKEEFENIKLITADLYIIEAFFAKEVVQTWRLIKTLNDRRVLDKSSLTRSIKKLEGCGLIERVNPKSRTGMVHRRLFNPEEINVVQVGMN